MTQAAIDTMMQEVMDWCREKGWYDDERTFGDIIALLHSECSEALEAFRDHQTRGYYVDHNDDDKIIYVDNADYGDHKPEGVPSEFADVLIRLLDDCGRYGIDLF